MTVKPTQAHHKCTTSPTRMLHVTFLLFLRAMRLFPKLTYLSQSAGELLLDSIEKSAPLSKRRRELKTEKWIEHWRFLVVHWARPGLKLHPCLNIISGRNLVLQTEERKERKAIDSRHTLLLYYIPSFFFSLFINSASEMCLTCLMHYTTLLTNEIQTY